MIGHTLAGYLMFGAYCVTVLSGLAVFVRREQRKTAPTWTVWVGGVEINDSYLSYDSAVAVAREYLERGYDDTRIEQTTNAGV